MTSTFRRGYRAFSLLETVLALGVLCFCLSIVLGLLPIGIGDQQKSEESAAASLMEAVEGDLARAALSGDSVSAIYGVRLPEGGHRIQVTFFLPFSGSKERYPDGPPVAVGADSHWRVSIELDASENQGPVVGNLVVSWPAAADLNSAAGKTEMFIALERKVP